MNPSDRLLSVGGQASYTIQQIKMMMGLGNHCGVDYYVDGNVSATGQGNSWESPFSTLSEALAASHAEIAVTASRHWARRNTIWVVGDAITEDLVALAQKTDIIGCGSYDSFAGMAGLIGNHVPVNAASGVRFFNMQFRGDADGGDMWTLSGTYSHGIEFHNCQFHADGGTAATAGIISTAVRWLQVQNCRFEGAFSDAVIEFGAGNASGAMIKNNYIQGANNGIDVASTTTMTPQIGYIEGNRFHVTGIIVNDDSDKFMVCDNIGYSAVATTTAATLVEVMDTNVKLSFNNYVSAGDITNCRYPVMDETGT